MAWSDEVNTIAPDFWTRFGITSGSALTDETGTLSAGSFSNAPTLGETGASGDGDTAIAFDGSNQYGTISAGTQISNKSAFTIALFAKAAALQGSISYFWCGFIDGSNYVALRRYASGEIDLNVRVGGNNYAAKTDAAVDITDFPLIVATFDAGTFHIYRATSAGVSDLAVTVTGTSTTVTPTGSATYHFARYGGGSNYYAGTLDECIIDVAVWSSATIADLVGATLPGPVASSIPMLLRSRIVVPAAALPMRLRTPTIAAAASLPMRLQTPDPTHYQADAAAWGFVVMLDDVDISSAITGRIEITHKEDSSGTARFMLLPGSGVIDPDTYERKPVSITFVGKDAAGATLYHTLRFTGVSTVASYDPDLGVVTIDATDDLQGKLENIDRTVIDTLIGGQWSEHIFDDSADGWQYAQDRLSTLPSEVHCNNWGQVVVVPWAAKTTADVTLTDAGRFGDSLAITRASRRDLLSRITVNLDFRFVRLRHRQIVCQLVDSLGFCHYLNNGWELPPKDTVRAAADGNEWTRISDISFIDLPAAGTYCTPSRAWSGNAEQFCLGASWTAARRWAQTITEAYTLNLVAPDIEETIGVQSINEDYGIEASFDATDYELIKAFDGAPGGAVSSPKTDDWQKDATDAEEDGRTAMEAAQACVLARARAEILRRARGNRVLVSPVYDPSIGLDSTVRVNTPYLVAKGKVFAISEVFDTHGGEPSQKLEIAISRHGGSGSAVDTTLDAAAEPEQPQEATTARTYAMPYHLGGVVNAPADNEDWDGWMTNVQASLRDPSGGVYRTRMVVRMPEIEKTARDALVEQQAAEYTVAIPEDELTMSN